MDSEWELESELILLITQVSRCHIRGWRANLAVAPVVQLISFVSSLDMDLQPKPESKFMSLTTQAISLFNSMDLASQPKPLSKLISLISESYIRDSSLENMSKWEHTSLLEETFDLKPEPELISLIHQIISLVISMKKLISVCPQVEARFENNKFRVIRGDIRYINDKWNCLPANWMEFSLTGREEATHFFCNGCNGQNHEEYSKAPDKIKHPLHKHSLQLVLFKGSYKFEERECYCCGLPLEDILYICSVCNFAINMNCVERPRFICIDDRKWHQHTLVLFPRQASLSCNVCAMTHPSCPFYTCPPCDFVVHQSCLRLPRVIRISRHLHRISFTHSFDQGDLVCGVCRGMIDNDYGGYSCIKDNCCYAAHSKCSTQRNVWDGIELEGEPEEDEKEVEPFVTISDGVIQHFSHQHYLRLDEKTSRDYKENKLCQACIMPIYLGNLYFFTKCDFILHKECAHLSRKIYHPIHPHMLTLVGEYDNVMDYHMDKCSACPYMCTTGFFYRCSKDGCRFKLNVQCASISEPLVHPSHIHSLFLTSKPGEKPRNCSICNKKRLSVVTVETFNCIECEFSLCFTCATLPQKVRYKHDKHMLTFNYGEETSNMAYWCEICEEEISPKESFYMCDEYCCVTLHITCMLGKDLYMKPSSIRLDKKLVSVLCNNQHMSRPICYNCRERCPYKIVFKSDDGSIACSTKCMLS